MIRWIRFCGRLLLSSDIENNDSLSVAFLKSNPGNWKQKNKGARNACLSFNISSQIIEDSNLISGFWVFMSLLQGRYINVFHPAKGHVLVRCHPQKYTATKLRLTKDCVPTNVPKVHLLPFFTESTEVRKCVPFCTVGLNVNVKQGEHELSLAWKTGNRKTIASLVLSKVQESPHQPL